jgi:hypothetical protein
MQDWRRLWPLATWQQGTSQTGHAGRRRVAPGSPELGLGGGQATVGKQGEPWRSAATMTRSFRWELSVGTVSRPGR